MREKAALPKPYYEKDGIVIYHGDCRELLDSLGSVDLVVTDPPYGMAFVSGHRKIKYDRIIGDDKLPLAVIEKCILKGRCGAYVCCRWDNLCEIPRPTSVLAWVKNNWSMGDLKHEHGRQWEAIAFYRGSGHEFVKRISDVIHANRTGNNEHQTEKPVSLMGALIAANVGNLILDPFMGSGSTLVAAKELGRRGIGIEIEERYCEVAANRLDLGKQARRNLSKGFQPLFRL
jgi:site-specific DNA-methyltransferase (adenine-specific)